MSDILKYVNNGVKTMLGLVSFKIFNVFMISCATTLKLLELYPLSSCN